MIGASVASWLVAAVVTGPAMGRELLAGMLGPLLVSVATWEMADQTFRHDPERLTGRMVTAFAAKMVFFGAYVAVMLLALALRPIPFVVSFTAYYIALHFAEALCLRRLFAGTAGNFR
jgi:uncharacterized membrane protein YdfJ with MMPL/SSD domain